MQKYSTCIFNKIFFKTCWHSELKDIFQKNFPEMKMPLSQPNQVVFGSKLFSEAVLQRKRLLEKKLVKRGSKEGEKK